MVFSHFYSSLVRLLGLTLYLICLGLAPLAQAIDKPLRTAKQIKTWTTRPLAVPVANVRVVMADYALLRKDFSELKVFSNEEIDAWLVRNAGYINLGQIQQSEVNTPISVDPSRPRIDAYQPLRYNRALVLPTEGNTGLLDVKGTGTRLPKQGDHTNGLATLGECIREFVYEKLVAKILKHANLRETTVGTYAVLDYGFDVKHSDRSLSPAGAVLRQAHNRFPGKRLLYYEDKFSGKRFLFYYSDYFYGSLDEKTSQRLESVLREYGITSAGAYYRDYDNHLINLQGTNEGHIVDFGGFLADERFNKSAQNFYGQKILLKHEKPSFPQPKPELQIPWKTWGYGVSRRPDPKADNPWIWSHELADSWRKGTAQRKDFDQHLKNMLDPVEEVLARTVRPLNLSPMEQLKMCIQTNLKRIFRK